MNKRSPHLRLSFLDVAEVEPADRPTGFLTRAFQVLHLRSPERSLLERAAAESRVAGLFSANFKSPWNQ